MRITFDPKKSEKNAHERGLPFDMAVDFDLNTAVLVEDTRKDYRETRLVAYGLIGTRVHVLCFKTLPDGIRVISLRKANKREVKNMSKKPPSLIDKAGEVRPLKSGDRVKMRLLREVYPELAALSRKSLGRPKSANAKKLQSFKLSPDVIEGIKNSGAGYNARVDKVLRQALENGLI